MTDGFDLGGSGGNSFSFGMPGSQPGAFVRGIVLDMKEVQKTTYSPGGGAGAPEFWDNGDPKMQYRVTLQTEIRDPLNPSDDGKRDVYLDGRRAVNDNGTKSKLCAVLDAVREVTGGTQLQRGGTLTLQWVSGMGVTGDPRNYAAWYEATTMPIAAAAPAGVQPAAAPPAAAAPVAPPQPGPVVNQGPPPEWAAPPVQSAAPTTPPPAGPPPAAPPAASAPAQHSPETIAALRAAGIDPAAVPVNA